MLLLVLFSTIAAVQAQNLQVNTTEGFVEGNKAADGNYHVFYGIPYADSTDGENRFKAPRPPRPYPGLFHAMDTNVICAQPSERGLIGVENCLTLSIFTNNVTTPKPVLVWLNAEEYTNSRTQSFSFRRFVEEGIVVVSMNFRLSIFGFLCLGTSEAPGNAGIKDVIQGLRWIQNNIAGFGGNPNNVILMGHSSAAAVVDILTYYPPANNLVHKAVTLSGSALAPWAVAYDPVGYAYTFAETLNYTKKSKSELATLLASTDISVLGAELSNDRFNFYNNTPLFAPCLENPSLNNSVLTVAPINILKSGNYSQIPYITSYVTREGTLKAEEAAFNGWLEKMQANFSSFLQVDLDFGSNVTTVAQKVNNFYFDGMPVSMSTIEDYLDYQGDTLILVSVIRGARERAATSKGQVRLLEFGFMGTLNSDWILNQIPLNGVKHGGILNYLFEFDLRPTEEHVMISIIKRFSNFAYTGNPTPPSMAEWSAITPQNLYYLYYGGSISITPSATSVYTETTKFNPHSTEMSLWDELYKHYYKDLPPSSASINMSMLWVTILSIIFCLM